MISICSGHRERKVSSLPWAWGHKHPTTLWKPSTEARGRVLPVGWSPQAFLISVPSLGMSVRPGWGHTWVVAGAGVLRSRGPGDPLHVHVGDFTSISWTLFPKPPQESAAVDTAVSNLVQVLSLNSLPWPSGYLFLRMESIWYYYELLFLIFVIIAGLY